MPSKRKMQAQIDELITKVEKLNKQVNEDYDTLESKKLMSQSLRPNEALRPLNENERQTREYFRRYNILDNILERSCTEPIAIYEPTLKSKVDALYAHLKLQVIHEAPRSEIKRTAGGAKVAKLAAARKGKK